MSANPAPPLERRVPLNRERVLRAALSLADRGGIETLTMRTLGQELGVGPMALYRHVRNKDEIIDGIVDLVFSEIDLCAAGADWKPAMRERAKSVGAALVRHSWAINLMESRSNPGPANLRHHDAVLANLRTAGFSIEMAAHAYSLLDSYIYGFATTQMSLPFESPADVAEVARTMLQPFAAGEFPNLVEFITEHAMQPGYDYANEFDYGLEVVLDGVERALAPDAASSSIR